MDQLVEIRRALLQSGENGFASRLIVQKERDYGGEYDHLARVAEWSTAETERRTRNEGLPRLSALPDATTPALDRLDLGPSSRSPPIRHAPPGCRPMPAPARRMC